jgi:hypothetical protein
MARFTGTIYIPFDIEYSENSETAENVIHAVLDTFGEHDLSGFGFTWDSPDWTLEQTEESANG